MNERRRLLTEYIRDDADEELDYFTIIPYSEGEASVSRIYALGYYVKLQDGTEYESDMWYSLDGGEWTQTFGGGYIDVPCFSRIRFKSNWHEMMKDVVLSEDIYVEAYYAPEFHSESGYDWWLLEGTPLSLLHGDNFKERKNDWNYGWDTFYEMFFKNNNIGQINNPKTFLPSTELTDYCYESMFKGSSILNAPELPAETLKEGCYSRMFYNCVGLEEAPVLNAKTLVSYCYESMFYGCHNIHYAKVTAIDGIFNESATANMFVYCADYGLAVLSQELGGILFGPTFFPSWDIISEDYPTNDEGYPETKGDINSYDVLCFNVDFRERYYDDYNKLYLNYYASDANEEGRQLYESLTSWMNKFEAVDVGGIYVNRHRPTKMICLDYEENGILEEWIQFNFDGIYGSFYGGLLPDGTFDFSKEEYLIHDYIK